MAADAPTLFGPSLPDGPLDLENVERVFWEEGYARVAGVDEVGRGALAGPVVAGAVILPPGFDCAGLADSKKLDPRRREHMYEALVAGAAAWAVGVASARLVDKMNILHASLAAMKRACDRLAITPDILLVDGNRPVPVMIRQRTVVGGDGRCASIAAASILAKVYRDRLMALLDAKYPGYAFAGHKGYSTEGHLRALAELGPSPAHRLSFGPVALAAGAKEGPLFRS
jgi:ribonuclease HII